MADGKSSNRKSNKRMEKSDKGLSASLLAGSDEIFLASRKSSTSMKKSAKGLSASLLAGSEEGFDFFCEPCSTENLHLEAVGFCTVCKEYLCDTCLKCHRKLTATKHHQLLGKDEMPKSTLLSKPTDNLQTTTQPDKMIDHFSNWSLSARQDNIKTKAQYLGEVCVKTSDDTGDCRIGGIAALPGGRIVVTDLDINTIKLVDTRRNKVMCCLPLSSEPFDVVTMDPNQVAALLRDEKKIDIFIVTDTLSRSSSIHVHSDLLFSRFCFDGEKFIIVCSMACTLLILNMSGSVLSTVSLDTFTAPVYIAVGRDSNVVYITDKEANTVTTMTLSGQVICVYKNDSLKTPYGVTVGLDNSVYVCSWDTDTVHQLSAAGELVRIILDEQRGLAYYPCAIAYDDEQDRLYISSFSVEPEYRNNVRSFKLQ